MPLDARLAVVGSTNPAKVAAVRSALARLAPGCVILAVNVPSGVSAQPVGDEETRLGAEARARAALALRPAELGFGLEGGPLRRDAHLAHLVGRRVGPGRPRRPRERPADATARRRGTALRAGEELAVIVDDLFHVQDARSAVGAICLLTDGAVSRTEAFAQLVAMALAPHLRPDLYSTPR